MQLGNATTVKKIPSSKKGKATEDSLKSLESDSSNLTGTFTSVLSVISGWIFLPFLMVDTCPGLGGKCAICVGT